MKILLFALNSSYTHTNLAVRCIAKPLRAAGYETIIAEYTLKDRRDEVLHRIVSEDADIYGFSCYIWNRDELLKYASSLKSLRPKSKIIFGGPEVSFEDESFFASHPYIDHIICGEGEKAFLDICCGKTCGKIIEGEKWTGFTEEGIAYTAPPSGKIVYYESSRGCPYSCAFCLSSLSMGVTAKSAEHTLCDLRAFEELSSDIKIVKFVDRTFNFDRERAKKIWKELLSPEYKLNYHFEICASLLDEETFDILSRFPKGKIQLEIGIQSTHEPTLKACCRHQNSNLVIENARRLHDLGNIHIHCDLIAGLPHESYKRFGQSFNETYGCCDMLQLGFLKLLRGSSLRNNASEYGIKYENSSPYTVLETADISFDELNTLKNIAALLERYENSGSFAMSIKYLTALTTPFEFFEGLHYFIKEKDGRHISDISQKMAFELLLEFGKSLCGCEYDILRSCLRFDYLVGEIHALPDFLRSDYSDIRKDEAVKQYMSDNAKNGTTPKKHMTEAHMFEFDPQNIYLIDRKNKSFRTIKLY